MAIWQSPAKINLYLAVTGYREDGFHEIDSLVAMLDFGDEMRVERSTASRDEYCCNVDLPFDTGNLVYRALELYRGRTGYRVPVSIDLEKRIPMGSGLGGGSSNASTMLKAVNSLNPQPVDESRLMEWSAEIGSDCPLFFSKGLMRIRGRGEQVEPFDCRFLEPGKTLRVLLFHPGFGIEAAWAYKLLRKRFSSSYTEVDRVEKELAHWTSNPEPWIDHHRNDLSLPVDTRYIAIPTLKQGFEREFDRPLYMSGSGSTCFCVLCANEDSSRYIDYVKTCWGSRTFSYVTVTR